MTEAATEGSVTVPPEKPKQATEYVVLRENTDPQGNVSYAEINRVKASGALAARAEAFGRLTHDEQVAGVTLVAVPKRSWEPKLRRLDPRPRSVEE